MNHMEELNELFTKSSLSKILNKRTEDIHSNHSSLRFESNEYRLRAIEIWDHKKGIFFRVYHADNIAKAIKEGINDIEGKFKGSQTYTDFRGDFEEIATSLCLFLNTDTAKDEAKKHPTFTSNSSYEGLILPDVDTTVTDILGRVFTWKEIIAISEDSDPNNQLKQTLLKSGIYLQRSSDGVSRYVGAAYNSNGGILARWLRHLHSNGDAKHLNLYVLEYGYNNLLFTVLEFVNPNNALQAESRWKQTLGSKNPGPYDGVRLNKN